MRSYRYWIIVGIFAIVSSASAQKKERFGEAKISPENLGLPTGNRRSSEPFAVRIYKTDNIGRILKKQPRDYPFSIKSDYKLKKNEEPRVHHGVDLSSRKKGKPAMLKYKAGVYGLVIKAGDGSSVGTIAVQLKDGTVIRYLHNSKSLVKVGDQVTPATMLGVTGKKGSGAIHLHIDAINSSGWFISPDLAFLAGQQKPKKPVKKDFYAVRNLDPANWLTQKPTVKDGVVQAKGQPSSKWIVEIIGMGGRIDAVLGEFSSYSEASYCSQIWSRANPKDLRLTRGREVKLKGKNDRR